MNELPGKFCKLGHPLRKLIEAFHILMFTSHLKKTGKTILQVSNEKHLTGELLVKDVTDPDTQEL